jgi:uncharacterized protein with NRDE domain
MCLILLAWNAHPHYRLVVAANRDEYHSRPASPAAFWRDHPGILAGRDLEAGGTWMGIARSGNFCAVTNFRGAREPRAEQSRGALVTGFLKNGAGPVPYIREVSAKASAYSGFNLLASDAEELWWVSNRGGEPRRLEPGIYVLGNALLDEAGLEPAKQRFAQAIAPGPAMESLFQVLAPARIVNAQYGTRCSTVLLSARSGGWRYAERSFQGDGSEADTLSFEVPARQSI